MRQNEVEGHAERGDITYGTHDGENKSQSERERRERQRKSSQERDKILVDATPPPATYFFH